MLNGVSCIQESKNFILEELDNPKEWQYTGRVDFIVATYRLSFWDQYKRNSHFQVEGNHLEMMKNMCAILGTIMCFPCSRTTKRGTRTPTVTK